MVEQFIGACVEPVMMIVTELVRGGTLSRYLHGIRPTVLDQKIALTYAVEISKVMQFLHANGIIHRDLKPGNHFFFFCLCQFGCLKLNKSMFMHLSSNM